jgi:hypothetical protein
MQDSGEKTREAECPTCSCVPVMKQAVTFLALVVALITWLIWPSSATFVELKPESGRIDLAETIPGDWDRLCILSPYTTNRIALETTGVRINVEGRSDIYSSDAIALFVTLKANQAAALFDVSRKGVDFAHLGGNCYPRNKAVFSVPAEGHPSAVPG